MAAQKPSSSASVASWWVVGLVGWLAAASGSCGAGSTAGALRPDDRTYAAVAKDGATSNRSRMLIVDWEPEARADLEVAMKQGVAVVELRDETVRLLDTCRLEGDYGFIGTSRKERVVRLTDGDEIRANLPFGGTSLAAEIGGELSRGATLDVALVMVGKRMTTLRRAFAGDLDGDCAGATHFVRGATVGAFVLATGSRAEVRTAVQLFGAGASGGSVSAKQVRTREGVLDDCLSADPESPAAPKQCSAPLRIDLTPILPGDDAQDVDEPADWSSHVIAAACPEGFVMRDDKCAQPQPGTGYQCRGIDAAECSAQCELDHGGSCLNLGWAYERGIGVDRDLPRAFQLYAKSCKLGTTEGCRALAFMYVKGLGVRADPAKARRYYGDACADGDALACSNLGVLYAHGTGVAKDIDRAVELYRRACNGGSPRGCINLGSVYEEGSGVKQDAIQAAKLFKRACIGDHPGGCVELGRLYDQGIGVARDRSNALSLYRRGCQRGHLEICVEVGIRYDSGKGAPEDPQRAAELFSKACEGGVIRGCANLGLLYRHGRGVAQDWSKAARLFQHSCEQGVACGSLGELYGLGRGVPKDLARARKLLGGACREGDDWACQTMRQLGL